MSLLLSIVRFALPFLGIVASIFVAATNVVHAAPVTLRFEAEIDRVSGSDFDSGIEFVVGDVVSGQFTYDPNPGDGETPLTVPQPYHFSIAINGVELASPSYEITADDDDLVTDFEVGSIFDQLELVGAGLSAFDVTADIDIDPLQSTFGLDLWGASDFADILETAQIPSNVEIWNQFDTWRHFRVTLRNGEGGVSGFSATVGDFSQVPEPASVCLSLSAAIGVFMLRCRMHKTTLNKKQEVREWVGTQNVISLSGISAVSKGLRSVGS
jgi:hypothetical protein